MDLNINILIIIVAVMLYSVFLLIIRILINKLSSLDEMFMRNNRRLSMVLSIVHKDFKGDLKSLKDIKSIRQNIVMDKLYDGMDKKAISKIENTEKRGIRSYRKLRRKEAAVFLGLLATDNCRLILEGGLIAEKDYSVKVYISNALTDIRDPRSLDAMVNAIVGSHKWYKEKGISNILEFGNEVEKYFQNVADGGNIEIIELAIKYCSQNYSDASKIFLVNFIDNYDQIYDSTYEYYENKISKGKGSYKLKYLKEDMEILLDKACRTMSNIYYNDFVSDKYYLNSNPIIQRNGLWALSKINSTNNFMIVLGFLRDNNLSKTSGDILSSMIETNPRFLYIIEDYYIKEKDHIVRNSLALVLSKKIEYYLLQLNRKHEKEARSIIQGILKNGKINEIIGFLNVNKDIDLENKMVALIHENVDCESEVGHEIRIYIKESILDKLAWDRINLKKNRKVHKRDFKLEKYVVRIMMISLLLVPSIFVLLNYNSIASFSSRKLLVEFVITFNYLLAFYSISINTVYLSLLVLSYWNVRNQAKLWNLKNISMLYRDKMIPSISIIAPAYNEEKNILSSVQSLLNLNYPDYELIVVNDGSTDNTLFKLISEFKLVKTEYIFDKQLDTAPVRGVYRNPSIPKLIVVDKSNGGKADSLNSGINISNKTYFCGIDSDSLLEPDSLLKLASITLDESCETPAIGGNIFPINGCSVDKGLITEMKIPKNNLARIQTVEYIRAFMAGRMGWQKLNSLLIISGAFGLFRKDRIIDIGGYLTEKGKYHKDTVGEDMELVVRISRLLHDKKQEFKVLYSYNSNAWTEVPEDIQSLRNQRFRWHRGLVEILHFHKEMFMRKKYGRTGMIAMPYFLIFEFVGPMIEIQGYIMVLLAAILGILDQKLALFLFLSTILYGMVVSLGSMLIAERENHYFSLSDLLKLLSYSIIENFGPRQVISFWRIRGQLSLLSGETGWGSIKRRGVKNE